MPELPEVETSRRGIEPHILQQVVSRVIVRHPTLRWAIPPEITDTLPQQIITQVTRRGKYLLLKTILGTVIIHLGMSGSLRIVPNNTPAKKHEHVDIEFGNGLCLRYTDPRRFGCVLWTTDLPEEHKLLCQLGPEPLSTVFDGDYLYARSRHKKIMVKQFIMDSHVVVGVGNIYANEVLFKAGVRPMRRASTLTKIQCEKISAAIKMILAAAIDAGGTTLKDFVHSDGKPGYFKQELSVYGREHEPCTVCGELLKQVRMNGRTTVYCGQCQK